MKNSSNTLTVNSVMLFIFAIIIFVVGTIIYWWSDTLRGLSSACLIIAILLFLGAILMLTVAYSTQKAG